MTGHHHHSNGGSTLALALVVTLGFAIVEAIGGWLSGSLALLGDAGHMLTDASALGLAAFAAWLSKRPPSASHSYGLVRAEVIAAILNSLFMLGVITAIAATAVYRLQHPQAVEADTVMLVALLGLIINIVVAWILHRGETTLNTRGALLHVMGDLLGSIAALISGAVIHFSGWTTIDPLLSLFICLLILFSTLRLMKEAIHVIMEGVPHNLELVQVEQAVLSMEGVSAIHDLHIWTLSSGNVALSAHVMVTDINQWQPTLARLQQRLLDDFHISHTTFQPEPETQPTHIQSQQEPCHRP